MRTRSLSHFALVSPKERTKWYYSSGLSNVLSKELRFLFETHSEYISFPFKYIFDKIGALSFVMELDPKGMFAGSSFSYATARDWAKLGQLFLQNGTWKGERILAEEVVNFAQIPAPGSGGHYGAGVWLNPAKVDVQTYNELPSSNKHKKQKEWITTAMPSDTYFFSGYQGQYVMIVPSRELVIVRLGLYDEDDAMAEGRVPKFSKSLLFQEIVKFVDSSAL